MSCTGDQSTHLVWGMLRPCLRGNHVRGHFWTAVLAGLHLDAIGAVIVTVTYFQNHPWYHHSSRTRKRGSQAASTSTQLRRTPRPTADFKATAKRPAQFSGKNFTQLKARALSCKVFFTVYSFIETQLPTISTLLANRHCFYTPPDLGTGSQRAGRFGYNEVCRPSIGLAFR